MARLRLSEWASIAEIIGALGVVMSLIYVGVQVKENTEEVRAANRQQLVRRSHLATLELATSPALATVFSKTGGNSTLIPAERMQYGYFLGVVLYDIQEAYLLHRDGQLEKEYWDTRAALLNVYVGQQPAFEVCDEIRSLALLHSDFAAWVEQNIHG